MNPKELQEKSMKILVKYYQNDVEPFLNALHPNVLWIGPLDGQVIYTKEAMVRAYMKDTNNITFHLLGLKSHIIHSTSVQCDILMTFIVDSFYPNGEVIRCNQRILLSWTNDIKTKKKMKTEPEPLILTCFIANALPSHEKDTIYPNNFTYTPFAQSYIASAGCKHFSAKGANHELLYLSDREILYIESKRPGCVIHTMQTDFYSSESVSEIYKKCSDILIRTHICYLVNPLYIRSVERFFVTLSTGVVLPIPEKKYTNVKKQIAQAIDKNRPKKISD